MREIVVARLLLIMASSLFNIGSLADLNVSIPLGLTVFFAAARALRIV